MANCPVAKKKILIIGGGAAGYFAAITAAENKADCHVVIAESGRLPLQKVAVSGGGRCNVTHACFDPKALVEAYPRGYRELRGAFSRFQPRDTVEWFASRGVELKTEEDGRMFPVTDSSQTIIDCFERAREQLKIELRTKTKVLRLRRTKQGVFESVFRESGVERAESFDQVLLACGSASAGRRIAESLGHRIEPCVPSLFTFEIKDPRLKGLSGVSVPNASLSLLIPGRKPLREDGPLLITHWGLSGPSVIRLSAWGARALHENKYSAVLKVNWQPEEARAEFAEKINGFSRRHAKQIVGNNPALNLPKRLWASLSRGAKIGSELRYAELSSEMMRSLETELFDGCYQITGKGVFKEEFVACGGVSLKDVDLRRMESKLVSGLFFAGEILDIDGLTGGYNFQNAWTSGFIAGSSMG